MVTCVSLTPPPPPPPPPLIYFHSDVFPSLFSLLCAFEFASSGSFPPHHHHLHNNHHHHNHTIPLPSSSSLSFSHFLLSLLNLPSPPFAVHLQTSVLHFPSNSSFMLLYSLLPPLPPLPLLPPWFKVWIVITAVPYVSRCYSLTFLQPHQAVSSC